MAEKVATDGSAPVAKPRSGWTRRAVAIGGLSATASLLGGGGVLLSRDGAGLEKAGRSRARPVRSGAMLPAVADVVVIGAGNIGAMTALGLAERGIRTVLCEKGVVAGESSGRSMGYIDASFADPSKIELLSRTRQLWADLERRIGTSVGYRKSGLFVVPSSSDELDFMRAWIESVAHVPGFGGEIVSKAKAEALLPGYSGDLANAYFCGEDAQAEPQLFAPSVAEAFMRAGGTLLQGCAVRSIERSGGRISGVVTEHGTIRCSSVVVAGGVWSPVMARRLGLDLPQLMGFSSNARLAGLPGRGPGPCCVLGKEGILARSTVSGHMDTSIAISTAPVTPDALSHGFTFLNAYRHLSSQIRPALNIETFLWQWGLNGDWPADGPTPFEAMRVFEPSIRHSIVDEAVRLAGIAFPTFGRTPVIEKWAGALTSTPDNLPVMSQIDAIPGLFIASGFYFGLTLAPVAGEIMTDLIMGSKPLIDVSPYRFSRFIDGSNLIFRE